VNPPWVCCHWPPCITPRLTRLLPPWTRSTHEISKSIDKMNKLHASHASIDHLSTPARNAFRAHATFTCHGTMVERTSARRHSCILSALHVTTSNVLICSGSIPLFKLSKCAQHSRPFKRQNTKEQIYILTACRMHCSFMWQNGHL
jgi:hypothetical protein